MAEDVSGCGPGTFEAQSKRRAISDFLSARGEATLVAGSCQGARGEYRASVSDKTSPVKAVSYDGQGSRVEAGLSNRTRTNPHPGPLPSDGRGRTLAVLCTLVEQESFWWS